jgi:hypothetical protein
MIVTFLPTLIVVHRNEVRLLIIDVSAIASGRYGVYQTLSISSATVTECLVKMFAWEFVQRYTPRTSKCPVPAGTTPYDELFRCCRCP